MLENVLFFINVLKFIHQTSAFVILLCWNFALLLSNIYWWGCKVWFSPQRRLPSLR